MGRTIEITGNSIIYVFYASSLAIVPILTFFVVLPLDDLASVVVAVLLAVLTLVSAADLWYWKRGEANEHLDAAAKRNLAYDITYRPDTAPGGMAKDYWRKAVRRLPGDDDEAE